MRCPRCGSENLRAISQTNTRSDYKGYGCCKGLIGYLILGPIGWLCGLCGMGKRQSTSTTRTFWECGSCGNKFK